MACLRIGTTSCELAVLGAPALIPASAAANGGATSHVPGGYQFAAVPAVLHVLSSRPETRLTAGSPGTGHPPGSGRAAVKPVPGDAGRAAFFRGSCGAVLRDPCQEG